VNENDATYLITMGIKFVLGEMIYDPAHEKFLPDVIFGEDDAEFMPSITSFKV